jgi:hypothetical protein
MKVLAALLFSLSFPAVQVAPAPRTPVDHKLTQRAPHQGSWYFAENGHAVYCYGPVVVIPSDDGGLQRVATFCRDGQTMVPLKD